MEILVEALRSGASGSVLREVTLNLSKDLESVLSRPTESLSDIDAASKLWDPAATVMLQDPNESQQRAAKAAVKKLQSDLMLHITRIFGEYHVALSDFYAYLSQKMERKRLEDAHKWCGRALLCRMTSLGLLHEKTAESHHCLGRLYALQGDFELSRKEFLLCRGIYGKIAGVDMSLEIAECDFRIGDVAMAASNYSSAYLAFYQCYLKRLEILGQLNPLTIEAEERFHSSRYINGETHISSFEVRNRVEELAWGKCDTVSPEYTIYIFLSSLQGRANYCLTRSQLKTFAQTAEKYSFARSGNPSPPRFPRGILSSTPSSPTNRFESPTQQESSSSSAHERFRREEHVNRLLAALLNEQWTPSTFIARKIGPSTPAVSRLTTSSSSPTSKDTSDRSSTLNPIVIAELTKSSFFLDSGRTTSSGVSGIQAKHSSQNQKDENLDSLSLAAVQLGISNTSFLFKEVQTPPESKMAEDIKQLSRRSPSPTLTEMSHKSFDSSKSFTTLEETKPETKESTVALQENDGVIELSFPMGSRSRVYARDSEGVQVVIQILTDVTRQDELLLASAGAEGAVTVDTNEIIPNTICKEAPYIPLPPPLPSSWPPVSIKLTVANCVLSLQVVEPASATERQEVDGETRSFLSVTALKPPTVAMESLTTVAGTIWELSGDSETDVPLDEIFSDFHAEFVIEPQRTLVDTNLSSKKLPVMSVAAKPKTPLLETALKGSRLQSLTIMLQKMAKDLSIEELASAVVELDVDLLERSHLESLHQLLPTSEEMALVEGFVKKSNFDVENSTNLAAKLGQAQFFVYRFSKIAEFEKRVHFISMHHSLIAEGVAEKVQTSAENILNAIRDVRGSHRLKYLLTSILQLSNAVNARSLNSHSGATSFKLSHISKLSQTKNNSGETLESYILTRLLHNPSVADALEVDDDISSIVLARAVDFQQLTKILKKFEEGVSLAQKLQETETNASANSRLAAFLKTAQQQTASTSQIFAEAQQSFSELCDFFGEDPKSTPHQFFGLLQQLLSAIERAKEKDRGKK